MTVVRFTVPGKPHGKGRPRVGRVGPHVRMFTPQETIDYESRVAHAAFAALGGERMFECAVAANLFIDCEVPGSWSQRKRDRAIAGEVFPTTKPDADNVIKAVFDGLNGVLWRDDVLVVDCRVRKRYSAAPGVRVEVWALASPLGVALAEPAGVAQLDLMLETAA